MKDLTEAILELVRLTATDLPSEVENALHESIEREEPGSAAREVFKTMLKNVKMARENATPICQDTGTPIFYVDYPFGWSTRMLRKQIENAVAEATHLSHLRPNAVNAITGLNTGDNIGDDHYPTVHFEEIDGEEVKIELILKGGGCENVGAQYKLPNNKLGAGRDLEGVRRVVLDAVNQAQGKGCAPGILGVAIGGDRGTSYLASKEALLRNLNDTNPDPALEKLEETLTEQSNELGIGPMGFGGKTTVLGTKVKALHRLPASYFVSVSYMCWAYRRRSMTVSGDQVTYHEAAGGMEPKTTKS